MSLESVCNNLINGNQKSAREGARRYSAVRLIIHMTEELGWSDKLATAAVKYLHTGEHWQEYCDIEIAEREAANKNRA